MCKINCFITLFLTINISLCLGEKYNLTTKNELQNMLIRAPRITVYPVDTIDFLPDIKLEKCGPFGESSNENSNCSHRGNRPDFGSWKPSKSDPGFVIPPRSPISPDPCLDTVFPNACRPKCNSLGCTPSPCVGFLGSDCKRTPDYPPKTETASSPDYTLPTRLPLSSENPGFKKPPKVSKHGIPESAGVLILPSIRPGYFGPVKPLNVFRDVPLNTFAAITGTSTLHHHHHQHRPAVDAKIHIISATPEVFILPSNDHGHSLAVPNVFRPVPPKTYGVYIPPPNPPTYPKSVTPTKITVHGAPQFPGIMIPRNLDD